MNPLLDIARPIPFDLIRAEHVEPAIAELLRNARERIEELAAASGELTYDSTLGALEECTERLDYAMSVVRHLEAVTTSAELRAAHNAVEPEVSSFYSSIPLQEGLWRMLRAYAESGDAGRLEGARKRHLEKTLDYFRRHGAELGAAGKERLNQIDVEISKLTTKFGENVLDATNAFELVLASEAQLAGLPESARAAARADAARKGAGGWRFTLQSPSYTALMTYLDDRALRERMYLAYQRRAVGGAHDNVSLLPRILELREEKARLLGFPDFADFALHDRMARGGEEAFRFLDRLREQTAPHFVRENVELQRFREDIEGPGAPPLAPWDIAYYAEKQRAALYEFDEEALRPYFPVEQVVAGLFETARRLFGVTIEPWPDAPTWHQDVKCYRILEEDGTLAGVFYADWFPRETKRGGAWMDAFLTGAPADPHRYHAGVILGNLTPPLDDRPALLTHREVETIFHEFGHLLHHCLSTVEVRSLAGTSVAWDFVELPSQILENWCWEREALDLFARHWQTGEPIPQPLFERMRRARTYRAANAQMRQLGFGILDLKLHREYEPARDGDVLGYARRILQEFSPAPLPEDYGMIAAFTHLFASPVGYGAGYYSYKWAEVLDADAFTRFRERGVFDRETGRQFRECVLSKGDSEDPGALYRAFMGRDPDERALLERQGLAG